MSKSASRQTPSRTDVFARVTGSQFQPALDHTEEALSSKPTDTYLQLDRCQTWREMGRFKEALAGYTKLIEASKEKPDLLATLYYERGRTHQESGDSTYNSVQALYDYEACIKADPQHYAAHVRRATLCHDIGEVGSALESAKTAIDLKPDCCYGYLLRARSTMGYKSHEEKEIGMVISDLKEAITLGDPQGLELMPLNWSILQQVLSDLENPQPLLAPQPTRN